MKLLVKIMKAAIEGGALMRVFAVAERLGEFDINAEGGRKFFLLKLGCDGGAKGGLGLWRAESLHQVRGDGCIVSAGSRENARGQCSSQFERRVPGALDLLGDFGVIG